jgi:hypothetical protein
MLHAEGGSGKTSILRALYRDLARGNDSVPVMINLRSWPTAVDEEWAAQGANYTLRMHTLLSQLARPTVTEPQIAGLDDTPSLVIFVDGLNEVARGIGNDVLKALDGFATRNPNLGCVVADRLARRSAAERWSLARVLPLSQEQIDRALGRQGEDNKLLTRAFFLNLALGEGIDSASSVSTFAEYFRSHIGLNDEELDTAARVAYQAYETSGSRIFPAEGFRDALGRDVWEKLVAGGAVVSTRDGSAFFEHHLLHDFLAARWMSNQEALWSSEGFDVVSFRASSFDAIALTLEAIEAQPAADEFVRRVYDWNFYASAYAVARGRSIGSCAVSNEMEVALLAMLAERKWDPILATAERVADAIRLFPGPLAQTFLSTEDVVAVRRVATESPLEDEDLAAWRAIYLHPVRAPATDALVDALDREESLIGWTAANVLRRTALTGKQEGVLRGLLREGNETVRWRAAHALGTHPSRRNAAELLRALVDSDAWVRYGAVRALIEQAALDPDLRDYIVEELAGRVTTLVRDEQTLQELERALVLREPPTEWPKAVEPLLEALWATATSLAEQDHWRQLSYDVQRQVKHAA